MGATRAMRERGVPGRLLGGRETREARNLWVRMDPGQNEGEGWFINGKEMERKHSRTKWTGGKICRDAVLG